MEKYVPPEFREDGFTCPYCEAYAHQIWFLAAGISMPERYADDLGNDVWAAKCSRCKNFTVWSREVLVDPETSSAPMPNPDLPESVKTDYLEARSIVARSPRGAAALLRLCIQKLCVELNQPGKDLNTDIGSLVKLGLLPTVQKMLDAVRVIGNNAVHPGEIDLNDTPEVAATLFSLVNAITDQMITHPRQVDELYETLPPRAREQIERRDRP